MTTSPEAQRDELAREIFITDNARSLDPAVLWDEADQERMHYAEVIADGLLAAGYRKPRTITTVEELDALPVGSVVMDADAYVGRKERDTGGSEWGVSLHKYSKESRAFTLPATVLWEPAA